MNATSRFAALPVGAVFSLVRESFAKSGDATMVLIKGRVWHAVKREFVSRSVIKGHPLYGRRLKKTSGTVAHVIGTDNDVVLNLSDSVSVS